VGAKLLLVSTVHAYLTSWEAACGMRAGFANELLSGPLVVYLVEDYVKSMDRTITTPVCVIAWLLCAMLACLAGHSPHCDLCDGPFTVDLSSPQPLVNHPLPATPDTCNGICWCCGFHWLPNAGPVLDLANIVTTGVRPESPSLVSAPRSAIFRPPRIPVSS
jgi:hypothetical protein